MNNVGLRGRQDQVVTVELLSLELKGVQSAEVTPRVVANKQLIWAQHQPQGDRVIHKIPGRGDEAKD